MKFKRKPLVIEASQFLIEVKPWPEGVIEEYGFWQGGIHFDRRRFRIKTLEGCVEVKDRDWIITGVKGERYPCKPDIFERIYERV